MFWILRRPSNSRYYLGGFEDHFFKPVAASFLNDEVGRRSSESEGMLFSNDDVGQQVCSSGGIRSSDSGTLLLDHE